MQFSKNKARHHKPIAASLVMLAILSIAMAFYQGEFKGRVLRPQKLPTVAHLQSAPDQDLIAKCGTPSLPEFVVDESRPAIPKIHAGGIQDTLGQIRSFFAWDLNKKQFHTVNARLTKIGQRGRVYLDTTLTTAEENLDRLSKDFDKIIYPIDTGLFGAEPRPGDENEIDGDSLITILLYDIRDDNYYDSTKTTFVAGFFFRENEMPRTKFPQSNEREMVYVDVRSLANQPLLTLGTLAHEFQHLIQWNQDPQEARWVNEGLSELAITACGYPRRLPTHFFSDPDLSLTTFNDKLEDYDKTYLYFMYVHEHLGGDAAIRAISTNSGHGETGVEAGLQQIDPSLQFRDIFLDWVMANYLDANGGTGEFAYQNIDLPRLALSDVFTALPVAEQSGQVQHYAADYYEFNGGKNLKINLDGDGSNFNFYARVAKFASDPGPPVVEDVALDPQKKGSVAFPDFGTSIKKVALVVIHAGVSPTFSNYSLSAEGSGANTEAVEIGYDDGRPFGYFQLGQNDTALVAFDGQQGMALDSVRFKFFSSGTAEFHIWRPRSNGLPGKDLITPFQHKVVHLANPNNNFEPWESFDLTKNFVDISQVFMVGMVMGTDAPDPKLIADSTNTNPPRSLVFVTGTQGRTWYLAGGDFMVRAFLSPLINDFSTPEITLGILQHPVFTENLDVYVFSPKALLESSIDATLNEAGTIRPLAFEKLTDDNRLFENQEVILQKSGTITIIVRATHTRGNIFGADTVSFTAQQVSKAATQVTSADQKVTLSLPAQAFSQPTWVTLFPAEKAGQIPGELRVAAKLPGYRRVAPARLIGPPNQVMKQPAVLRWKFDGPGLQHLFLAKRVGESWEILKTQVDVKRHELFTNIQSTGEYALLLSEKGDENRAAGVPETFVLKQNYPNPFNPATTIRFAVPEAQKISLTIYNLQGQAVRHLVQAQPFAAGWHQAVWDARDDRGQRVASGVYLYQLQGRGVKQMKKMTLLK